MKLHKFVVTIPESDEQPEVKHETFAVNAAHALSNIRSHWQRCLQSMKLPKRFNRAQVSRP